MVTGLTFVNFCKAFDVINPKLSIYGVNDLSLKWFRSYLTDRKQYVRINGYCSTSKQLLQGVPKGSILGPILFLLFVNDMLSSICHSTLDIYADDTTLLKLIANDELGSWCLVKQCYAFFLIFFFIA